MIGRLINHLIQRIGIRTLLNLALLGIALSSVSYGLANILRDANQNRLMLLTWLAILLGWLLGRSRLRARWALPFASVVGVVVVIYQVGELTIPTWHVLRAAISFLWDFSRIWVGFTWQLLFNEQPNLLLPSLPDAGPLIIAWQTIDGTLGLLLSQATRWTTSLLRGEPSFLSLVNQLVWSLLVWLGSIWAAWCMRRLRNPLLGVVPAGLLLVFSINYVRADTAILLPYTSALLLMMTTAHYSGNIERWETNRIDYADNIGQDLGITAVLLTIVIMAAATLAHLSPTLRIRALIDWTRELLQGSAGEQAGPIAEGLGLEQQNVYSSGVNLLGLPGMPREHLVGSSPKLREQVVMTIQVKTDTPEPVTKSSPEDAPRYYWHGITYDEYTGRGWRSSWAYEGSYQANDLLMIRYPPYRQLIHQTVNVVGNPGTVVHIPGDLLSVDQAFQTFRRPVPEWEEAPPQIQGFTEIDLYGATSQQQLYQVDSLLVKVGADTLRAAGENYPNWVRNRYLFLPSDVPGRTLTLAYTITVDAPTPYDQAIALQSYLRQYPYTLDIPPPPNNVDIADYFLFDLKKGYCDYYATAMVVMARSLSIPARLVVGFAPGIFDPANQQYVISEADAHSWVEIYFPEIGWVAFEPTAGLPPIERTSDVPVSNWAMPEPGAILARPPATGWERWAPRLTVLGMFSIVLLAIVWGFQQWRLSRLSSNEHIIRIYTRLLKASRKLADGRRSSDTPNEIAEGLAARLDTLSKKRWIVPALSAISKDMRQITHLYEFAVYSPHPATTEDVRTTLETWKRLSLRLRWARLLAWLRRPTTKKIHKKKPGAQKEH